MLQWQSVIYTRQLVPTLSEYAVSHNRETLPVLLVSAVAKRKQQGGLVCVWTVALDSECVCVGLCAYLHVTSLWVISSHVAQAEISHSTKCGYRKLQSEDTHTHLLLETQPMLFKNTGIRAWWPSTWLATDMLIIRYMIHYTTRTHTHTNSIVFMDASQHHEYH